MPHRGRDQGDGTNALVRIEIAAIVSSMRCAVSFFALVLLGGCDDRVEYQDDDFPTGQCDTDGAQCLDTGSGTETTVSSDTGNPLTCVASEDCDDGFCVAPVDTARGASVCRPACVETMDETAWCADAAACCDPQATCNVRGYCAIVAD